MIKIDSKIPEGPVAEKWTNHKAHQKLVNPANKRRLDIIVVGTGLACLLYTSERISDRYTNYDSRAGLLLNHRNPMQE